MTNKLVEHAVANAWCSPDQDKQYILRPARISAEEGHWNKVKVLMKSYALPDSSGRFHVYQIGQVFPIILGLLPLSKAWVNFAVCCEQQRMSLDVYSDKGIKYPNHLIWYRYTDDRNLIMAIAEHKSMPIVLSKENVYLRLYSNSYFNSNLSSQIDDFVKNEGTTVNSLNDIITFQHKVSALASKPGVALCYVNGFYVDQINPFTAKAGDVVEYFHDGSVKKVVNLNIKDLEVFNSILDGRRKYLVHPPKDGNSIIDYRDDVDFYLFKTISSGNTQGVYYHKNKADSVRMVTHRDYSIQVPYVVDFCDNIPDSIDPDKLTLRMFIRNSGYSRPLVQENNRIHELYKLSDRDIVRSLVGIDSTVPNWKADTLELSSYAKIMDHKGREIPVSMVEDAYGYNAISKIIGDTPTFAEQAPDSTNGSLKIVNLPYGLQKNSTVYEYDQTGKLAFWKQHDIGAIFPCEYYTTRLAEVYSGIGGYDLDDFYGEVLVLDPACSYRYYISPILNGIKQNTWVDVTGKSQCAVVDGKATWLVNRNDYETLIRSDKKILTYNIAMMPQYGVFRFAISQIQDIDGVIASRPLRVPTGELDIFLNGKSLINKLDYVVDFPNVTIFNKEYLIDPDVLEQLITVRAKGFCDSDLKQDPDEDFGFVCFGMLSGNTKYDIRDDKVLRIILDGELKDRTDLKFAEDSNGIEVGSSLNGRPYLIKDIVVPTRGLTNTDTYELRSSSLEIDKAVGDFMSLKHPEVKRTDTFTIPNRYQIYSPLCAKILFDLKHGILNDSRLKDTYGDSLVIEICKRYNYLLAIDPCHDDNYPDDRFVEIHPHHLYSVVDVDAYTYKFMSRVVKVILKDRVNLSHFVRIVT